MLHSNQAFLLAAVDARVKKKTSGTYFALKHSSMGYTRRGLLRAVYSLRRSSQ